MDIYDIALTLTPQIGSIKAKILIERFGSAQNIFKASRDELQSVIDISEPSIVSIIAQSSMKAAEQEIKFITRNGIKAICSTDENYPIPLKQSHSYPHVLYVKGEIDALHKNNLSIVGTRKMTEYGRRVCSKIVEDLASSCKDFTIVSGLALGVDGAAHREALLNKITTVAVLPTPICRIFPSDHAMLAKEILDKGGALISDYHSKATTTKYSFVARNRIIAGISAGTLVIESPINGGAIETARIADTYGRSVMAIPGRIYDSASTGTNQLIKTRLAVAVSYAIDILNELGWSAAIANFEKKVLTESLLTDEAKNLLTYIREGDTISKDMLSIITGLSVGQLAPLILELELDNIIIRLSGNRYERQ